MPRALVNTSERINKIERTAPKLPPIGNVEGVTRSINALEKLRLEFNAFLPSVQEELANMEQLRDLLFRHFANNNAAIRDLIAQRDRIRTDRLYQAQKRTSEMVTREIGAGLRATEGRSDQKMSDLESRAERLFGVKVSADEFEILTIKNRRLTDSELQLIARISSDTETVQSSLEELNTKLEDILTREVSLRQQFEKFAGVSWDTYAKTGKIAALAQRIQGAVETFRTYDTQIKQVKSRVDSGIASMKSIRGALDGVDDGSTFGDIAGNLGGLSALSLAGALGALALGANPIAAGVLATVALLGKVVSLGIELYHRAFGPAPKEGDDE